MRVVPLLLATLFLPSLGDAAPPTHNHDIPVVRSVEDAGALASEVFEQRDQRARDARKHGVQEARRAARAPLQRITVDAAPGVRITPNADLEHEFESNLWFELSARAKRAQHAWDQADLALSAQQDAARWLFVTEAERRFAHWWAQQAIADHLEDDLNAVREKIDAWRNDLEPWLSELDLLDLDAESARLSAEVAQALIEAQNAESEFRAHITIDVDMVLQESPDDALAHAGEHNPWTDLAQHLEKFPEIQALEAQAQHHTARANAHKSRSLELGLGARARLTPRHNVLLNPMVSLEIPIAQNNPQEAAIDAAEAAALHAQAQWKRTQLRAWLQGEADRHQTLVRALTLLDDRAIEQLQARVDRLAHALEGGHVDVRRLFWALRDLHEAKHQALLLRAELAASEAAASGVQQLLETPTP